MARAVKHVPTLLRPQIGWDRSAVARFLSGFFRPNCDRLYGSVKWSPLIPWRTLMQKVSALAVLIAVVSAGVLMSWQRPTHAQAQDVPAGFAPPSEIIGQMMGLIGQNKIDEATAMMDGLKDQPDARNAARDKLIRLRDELGAYRGYDIAASQRFTSQFQIVDVMAYYDQQPVLMRFHFYRPAIDRWLERPGISNHHVGAGHDNNSA